MLLASWLRRHWHILAWGSCTVGAVAGALLLVLGGGRSLPAIPAPSVAGTAVSPGSRDAPDTAARPVRIVIPSIGISAPVKPVGLNADGTLQMPPLTDRNLAAWYDRGAAPGQDGPAVVVGHVDSYLGPSVFFRLHALRPGDAIEIWRQDASVVVFTVSRLQEVPKSHFPTGGVYGPVPDPELRLVTCGGEFNPALGSYEDNLIVYAVLSRGS
jgi:sortase (surface protein transpeptidase)